MQYSVATIQCGNLEDWQVDILCQQLADLGFDSFEQDDTTLRAYIPTSLLDSIHTQLSTIHGFADRENTQLTIASCPDENWNAVWEASHPIEQLPLGVSIIPHCAFGAGHHETTSMMIQALTEADLTDKLVYDHGTGTGVLGIFAKRLGAEYVLADDIDDNSVRNALENAERNGVSMDVRLAPSELSEVSVEPFHLILANIHRNILLAQMADYARNLLPGGELWLSGFYEQDIPALVNEAESCGLKHTGTRSNGEWRMLLFQSYS